MGGKVAFSDGGKEDISINSRKKGEKILKQ
jgi:hypothetical protein